MKTEWEIFLDRSYFHMWAVRPIGDKDFNSPRLFHFSSGEDATRFKELVEKAYVASEVGEFDVD